MSMKDLCRLCLSKENLVWIFDERLDRTNHMKDVIHITTGVEIHSKDVVSQKICTKCVQNVIKMLQFRKQCHKNDRYLKAQCREVLRSIGLKIPNTSVRIKTGRVENEEIAKESCYTQPYKVHPTVTALFRKYPKMQLPSRSLLSNVNPCVSLELDAVESYFHSRNLKMQRYVQLALRASEKYMPKKKFIGEKSLENSSSEIVVHTEQANRVRPINIKIKKTGYTIVQSPSANEGDVNFMASSSTLNTNSSDSVEEVSIYHKKKHKKRRHSGDSSTEPKLKKSFLINSSDINFLQPLVQEESVTVRNEETPQTFECEICSSKLSSAKHLQDHNEHHFRCMFCKLKFRSVEMKLQHIEYSCLVKEASNNSPDVVMERVDLDLNIRQQFSETFKSFAPLPILEKPAESATDIIEILSDDEDSSVSPSKSQRGKLETNASGSTTRNNDLVPVIKPDVRMKNRNVMDSFDTKTPELNVLTELLSNYPILQSNCEVSTQTELPTTDSIELNKENFSVDLKNLKEVLHNYKIPVVIRNGSIGASYTYQSTPEKPKTMKLWRDLNPIDVTSGYDNRISNSEPKIAETLPNQATDTTSNTINDQLSSHTTVHNLNVSSDFPKRPESIFRRSSFEVVPLQQTTSLSTTSHSPITDFRSLKNAPNVPPSFVSSTCNITSRDRKSPIQATAPITTSSNSRFSYINSQSHIKSPILAKSPDSVGNLPSITPLHSASYNSVPSNSPINDFEKWIDNFNALTSVDINLNSPCIPCNNSDSLMHSKPDSISDSSSFTSDLGPRQSATILCQDKGYNSSTFNLPRAYYAKEKPKITRKIPKSMNKAFERKSIPETANCCSSNVSEFKNSNVSDQNYFSNRALNQNSTPYINTLVQQLFVRPPPPPYSSSSSTPSQSTQSYRFPYNNSTSRTVHQTTTQQKFCSQGYGECGQYFSQALKLLDSRTTTSTCPPHLPKNPVNAATNFSSSNLPRQSLESSRVTTSAVTGSAASCLYYPNYSDESASYANVIANHVSQNYSTVDGQIPNTTYVKKQTTFNRTTYSSPASNKGLTVGSIRVRNVSELT